MNEGKHLIENKYSEYYIFLGDFFSESMKKGSGGRITSLTLEEKGDGEEGGDGSEMRRQRLRLRAAARSGGPAAAAG